MDHKASSRFFASTGSKGLDVTDVYDSHADFVWRSLQRMGVPSADLQDLLQEVFVIVHRKRSQFDPHRALRGWLWGICLNQVRNHRRRHRRERSFAHPPERAEASTPEAEAEGAEQRLAGQRALAELDPEKRAVFLMFEVEGLSGKAIAELLDIPIGTVHSRLHTARRELAHALGGAK